VVAQWQSTPLVRVRSRVQSSLTAPSEPLDNKEYPCIQSASVVLMLQMALQNGA
jgi:hypothetical protein